MAISHMMGKGTFNNEVQRARKSILGLWPASKMKRSKRRKKKRIQKSRQIQENLKEAYGDSTKGKKILGWEGTLKG